MPRIALVAGCALFALAAIHPAKVARADEPFRTRIAPIFERHCVSCHQGESPKGGLSLTGAAGLAKGGDSGPVVEPKRPDESLLLEAISGEKPAMPKQASPLAAADVAAIRQWIADGAAWPADLTLRDKHLAGASDQWWSWQPLTRPAVPRTDSAWIRTPIDAFVLAKLKEQKLHSAPEADRPTLIRRLTYDLHGLPPTPAEIDMFLADQSADALERLIDRLLSSPRYGEHWGRHWLDVVHFGETHGYDKDKTRPYAWPYRDYVIRSLNDDKPYSRFIEEQLAGDVLFPQDPWATVATGFIAAGPWDFVGHVELREGTLDKKIARSNDRDDMVATAMSTFMSLTVHCARCHNHKFDPIAQEDYYKLQAVFAGIDRGNRPFDLDPATHQLRRTLAAEQAVLRNRKQAVDDIAARANGPEIAAIDQKLQAVRQRLTAVTKPAMPVALSPTLGYHSQLMNTPDATKWVQVDLGVSQPIDMVALFAANVKYGGHPGPGFGFPPRFRVEISDDPTFTQSQVIDDQSQANVPNPGDTPYVISTMAKAGAPALKGRYVRVTATRLWERTKDWIFALSELVVFSGDENISAGKTVTALDSIEAGMAWAKTNLVDGFAGPASLQSFITGESPTNGYHSGIEAKDSVEKWVQVDLGQSLPLDRLQLIPARPTDFADTPGFGFPLRYRVDVSDDPTFAVKHTLQDQSAADMPNPGNNPVEIPAGGVTARYVRITALKLWKRMNDYVFALAELQVESRGKNVARGAAVKALDTIDAGRWHTRFLVDDFSSRQRLGGLAASLVDIGGRMTLERELKALEQQRIEAVDRALDEPTRKERQIVIERLAEIDRRLGALPAAQMVYAATPLTVGEAKLPAPPRPVHFLHRGSDKTPGELMSPGAIASIPRLGSDFPIENANDEGSRRAALAKWITDPHNAFTRRSIVNRVWQYHFGRGLVETPNDFGHMGARPTHPELLDWLAVEFQESGESLKQLHRLILRSAVYRQSTQHDAACAAVDGSNQYLWRMNRLRLDAEPLRDSVLAVAGKLDLTMAGPSAQQFFFKDDHSPVYDYTRFDVDSAGSFRRGVYRFIVRSVPDPFMECLDCADPSLLTPKRNTTLTSLQALSLMNNNFMLRQCEHFAERLRGVSDDPARQVEAACLLAYGRPPRSEEGKLLAEYAAEHGLANLCRLIFNSNEFLFVD